MLIKYKQFVCLAEINKRLMDSDGISQFRYDFIIFKLVNTIRVCYKSSYFNGSFSFYAKLPNYDQKKGKSTCLSERSECSVERQDNIDAYFNLSVMAINDPK